MAEKWSGGSLKTKVKLVIFALTPTVLIFGCAELFAGLTIRREISVVTDPASGQRMYTMRIGLFPWSHRSVTPLNALGFPDHDFSNLEPKSDCVHLVFSGDSFVFGDGVDRDSSFVELVKRRAAAEHTGRCVRMFNVAERATTIVQQTERVRETLEILQPDVVILGQYQNDLTDLMNPRLAADSSQVQASRRPIRRWTVVRDWLKVFNLDLVRYLSYHAFGYMITQDIRYDALSRWSVLADSSTRQTAAELTAIYSRLYDTFVAELRQRGIAFGVIVLPSKFDILAQRYPEEAFFVSLAEKHEIPHLSLFQALDANRSPYPYLVYDGHLNEAGNRVIAAAVYEWLYHAHPAPFPRLRAAKPKRAAGPP